MSLQIRKDTRGRDRWTSFSSTAYLDRDQEIVSTKALADDCDRADRDGNYGPLLWWHQPALILGDCDFNAMHGRVLIESGTFRSPAIAQKIAKVAPHLGVSIGFVHLPNASGIFHKITRFERSLVPHGKASNLFTGFQVKVKEHSMATLKEAWETAKRDLGLTDEDLLALQAGAEQREKMARELGMTYKGDPAPARWSAGNPYYQQLERGMLAQRAPQTTKATFTFEQLVKNYTWDKR